MTGTMASEDEPTTVVINKERRSTGNLSEKGSVRVRRRGACGAAGAGWRELAGACASETAGTALLLLLTCLPAAAAAPLLTRALTAGLVVATLVQCFDHISGAMFNPTVVAAALVAGRLRAARAAALLAAQLAGAGAAAALLPALAPRGASAAACAACVTRPASHLPVLQALCIEAALGAVLALANCAAWDARNRRLLDSWPLRVGLAVVALSLVAGDLTGASMNPMRSLGPALCAADWTHHWIYWVGPLSGSVLVSALYRALWVAPPATPPRDVTPPARRRTLVS